MNLGAFSRFSPRCDPIELPNGKFSERWTVTQKYDDPFFYWSNKRGVIIPPNNGMKTDFGSIPKPLQAIHGLDRMTFLPSYVCHDFLYWYRYALKPRLCVEVDDAGMIRLTPAQKDCLLDGIFEPNDNTRIWVYGAEFSVVPVGRLWSDGTLNEMMFVQSHGDAAWERPVVQSGLFVGGWVPWWLKNIRFNNPSSNDPQNHEIVTA